MSSHHWFMSNLKLPPRDHLASNKHAFDGLFRRHDDHGDIPSTDPSSHHPQRLYQPRHRVLQIRSQHVRATDTSAWRAYMLTSWTASCSRGAYTPRMTFIWLKSTVKPSSSHRTSHWKTTSIGGSERSVTQPRLTTPKVS